MSCGLKVLQNGECICIQPFRTVSLKANGMLTAFRGSAELSSQVLQKPVRLLLIKQSPGARSSQQSHAHIMRLLTASALSHKVHSWGTALGKSWGKALADPYHCGDVARIFPVKYTTYRQHYTRTWTLTGHRSCVRLNTLPKLGQMCFLEG